MIRREGPLLVIDARRSSATALERTLEAASERFECWVLSHEKPDRETRVSKWISADSTSDVLPEKIRDRNRKTAVLISIAGETQWPETSNPHALLFRSTCREPSPTWQRWAFAPVSHFVSWTSARLAAFLDGSLGGDRPHFRFRLSHEALKNPRVLVVASKDLDQLRSAPKDRVQETIERYKKRNLTFFLAPVRLGFVVRVFFDGKSGRSLIGIEPGRDGKFDERELNGVLTHFFESCGFDSVRFEQVHGLQPALIEIAKKMAKTVVSISEASFCELDPKERQRLASHLNGVRKVVPSRFAKRSLTERFGFAPEEIEVETDDEALANLKRNFVAKNQFETFAFVGEFSKANGSQEFARLVRTLSLEKTRFRWIVLGAIVDSALALDLEDRFGVEFFGPCSAGRARELLRSENVDAVLILPKEGEFSVSAVLDAVEIGCWPLVSAGGAPAECVESLEIGAVLRPQSLVSDFRRAIGNARSIPIERTDSVGKNPGLHV